MYGIIQGLELRVKGLNSVKGGGAGLHTGV